MRRKEIRRTELTKRMMEFAILLLIYADEMSEQVVVKNLICANTALDNDFEVVWFKTTKPDVSHTSKFKFDTVNEIATKNNIDLSSIIGDDRLTRLNN